MVLKKWLIEVEQEGREEEEVLKKKNQYEFKVVKHCHSTRDVKFKNPWRERVIICFQSSDPAIAQVREG